MSYRREIPAPPSCALMDDSEEWLQWLQGEQLVFPVAPVLAGTCRDCYGAVALDGLGVPYPRCWNCRTYSTLLDGFVPIAYSFDDGLESLVKHFKDRVPHRTHQWMADPLGSLLIEYFDRHAGCLCGRYGSFDRAAFVPASNVSRGFDHLAEIVERFDGWPMAWEPGLVQKAKPGKPGRGVVDPSYFRVSDSENVDGQSILLFDDLWTSGSDMASIAALLRGNGAAHVVGITLGRQINPYKGYGNSETLALSARERSYDKTVCVLCG